MFFAGLLLLDSRDLALSRCIRLSEIFCEVVHKKVLITSSCFDFALKEAKFLKKRAARKPDVLYLACFSFLTRRYMNAKW